MTLSLNNKARWAIVNRNSGKQRRLLATRDAARAAKRPTERIWDTQNAMFVR